MSFKPFLAYSASAGSGKTFALSVRYISLLFLGESPSHILAATFTNKAATEMRQRVLDSLKNLHTKENEPFLDAISQETLLSKDKLLEKQPEIFKSFVSTNSYIVTLDSFFSSVLRSSSLELGLEPNFVTKDEGDSKLEEYFLDEVDSNSLLSDLVKLATDIEDKRFGKIFDLMQNFYKIDPLLPDIVCEKNSINKIEESIESLRVSMLKALIQAKSTPRCLKQFETKNTKELFEKKLFEHHTIGEHSWFKKVSNDEIENIYAKLKEDLKAWTRARENRVLCHLFKIYDYYKNATISNAKHSMILTFDDLTYFTHRLLHESISREFLYFKLDTKFKHILLDEFQDTSTLQFLLLKPLVDEIFSGYGQSEFKSFFYVGDTKQSLYRFRGGVEELFDKIAENYGIKIEQMYTNYRSSIHVVEQVNRWFEPIMDGYIPQNYKTNASQGFVKVIESDELIDDAVKQVKLLIKSGIDLDNITLLVNTNKDGQSLQEECNQQNIDTLLKTSSSLKSIPKIASLVAMVSYMFYGYKIDSSPILLKTHKLIEDVDTSWFSVFMSPIQAIDELIKEFKYFNSDLNILKLLEYAAGFDDISTFLEEFETSRISVASNSLHGVKIMTIHGSKGLEFEYVVLLDKLTKPNPDKSVLIYDYNDELNIDTLLYRTKGRDNFDDKYKTILDKRKLSQEKDRKNILYVALTRAVEGLVVIRKPKGSIFDEICMESMNLGNIDSLIVSSINKKSISKNLYTKEIQHYGRQQKSSDTSDEPRDYNAILFGNAIHYTLEVIRGFNLDTLDHAIISLKNIYGQQLSEEEIIHIKYRVTLLLNSEKFTDMLKGAKVNKERSLSYKNEIKQVDLLLEFDNHNIVIDYKSSKKYASKHQKQVSYYKHAISNITKKECKGIIIYLLKDSIEFVEV